MPRPPTTSPATGRPVPSSYIHTFDTNFVDTSGRTLLLRGVNLSGASKAPVGHLSHQLDDFWSSAEAGGESFVGRPLNLDDGSADVHLARLRGWGFNFLRFPITWEALEHQGPGKYDYEFMDYTIQVLLKCKEYGFRVFLDPHQDTWSRFTGGSGAPYWTLPLCGINPAGITATQAAIVHCEYPYAHEPDPASLPAMIWSTNYGRLLSQTLFTFFFAGRTFAPLCLVDGMNIQDYLQGHFVEAFGQLSDRIRQYDDAHPGAGLYDECIIGWDSLNEPFEGLVEWENLNENPKEQGSTLKKGTYSTPAQSLRLGMGQTQTVENWTFGVFGPSRNGSVTIDPKGIKLWADPVDPEAFPETLSYPPHSTAPSSPVYELPNGHHPLYNWKRDISAWPLGTCPWALHKVWDIETGFVLRPDYFKYDPKTGVEVSFIYDFWKPHWERWSGRLRRSHPEAVWFVQPPVFAMPPRLADGETVVAVIESNDESRIVEGQNPEEGKVGLGGRCCYSCHYYDGLTLITRHWNWFNADALGVLRGKYSSPIQAVKVGESAIRKSLQDQLSILKSDAQILGPYPTVIGEIGVPFDMDSKRSYGWTDKGKYKGDYTRQEKALDASLNATEGVNGLNWTVWTFCPDDHSHEWGDGWNMEDLSLWSPADVWTKDAIDQGSTGNLSSGASSTTLVRNQRSKEGLKKMKKRQLKDAATQSWSSSRESVAQDLVNRKPTNKRRTTKEQPKPSLAMVAAASSLSVASLGSVTSSGSSVAESAAASTTTLAEDSSMQLILPSSQTQTRSRSHLNQSTTPALSLEDSSPPSTSGSPSRSSASSPTPSHSPSPAFLQKLGWHANPYDFLRDGARAYKAFCRPYPVKTVGKIKDMGFDIQKATWWVVIGVSKEDEPVDIRACHEGEKEQERLATEIYVPLVHFAHPRLLRDPDDRKRRRVVKKVVEPEVSDSQVTLSSMGAREERGSDNAPAPALETPTQPTISTTPTPQQQVIPIVGATPILRKPFKREPDCAFTCPSQVTLGRQPVVPYLAPFADDDSDSSSRRSFSDDDSYLEDDSESLDAYKGGDEVDDEDVAVYEDEGEGPLVDIEIKVSEGTYRVDGQALFWWYDVPASNGGVESEGRVGDLQALESRNPSQLSLKNKQGEDEEGVKEVRLEIRRRGGAIKKAEEERGRRRALMLESSYRYPANRRAGESSRSIGSKKGDGTLCEEICNDGCSIM